MKANSVGLSFGFLVTSEHERADGIRELHTIDLFEISLTPAPMNPDAKILSWKAASKTDPGVQSDLEAITRAFEAALEDTKASEPATKSSTPITVATFDC